MSQEKPSKEILKEIETNLEDLRSAILSVFDYEVPIKRYYNGFALKGPAAVNRDEAIRILNQQTNHVIRSEILTTILVLDERAKADLITYLNQMGLLFNQIKTIIKV